MKMRIIGAVFAGLALAGCSDSDWNTTMSYVGLGQSDSAAQASAAAEPVAAPTPAASKSDDWCREIAKAASDDAAGNGFDAATQRHRAKLTYRQCSESSPTR